MGWKFSAIDMDHQTMLDILRTTTLLLRLSDRFFAQYGISEAQFAAMMSINEEGEKGLSQQELSDKLMAQKSNIVKLIDRLEKKGCVKRLPVEGDRRVNRLVLAEGGINVLKRVEKPYLEEVRRLMGEVTLIEKMAVRSTTAKLMKYANKVLGQGTKWPEPVN